MAGARGGAPRSATRRRSWRVKGARRLPRRGLAVLRELHAWRERRAEATDRPPFRILANEALLAPGGAAAAAAPAELARSRWLPPRLRPEAPAIFEGDRARAGGSRGRAAARPGPPAPRAAARDRAGASRRCASGARRRRHGCSWTCRWCCRSGCSSAWRRPPPPTRPASKPSPACAAGGRTASAPGCSPRWATRPASPRGYHSRQDDPSLRGGSYAGRSPSSRSSRSWAVGPWARSIGRATRSWTGSSP